MANNKNIKTAQEMDKKSPLLSEDGKILFIGAGQTTFYHVHALLRMNPNYKDRIIIIEKDDRKVGTDMHGIPVQKGNALDFDALETLIRDEHVEHVYNGVAMLSLAASNPKMKEMVHQLNVELPKALLKMCHAIAHVKTVTNPSSIAVHSQGEEVGGFDAAGIPHTVYGKQKKVVEATYQLYNVMVEHGHQNVCDMVKEVYAEKINSALHQKIDHIRQTLEEVMEPAENNKKKDNLLHLATELQEAFLEAESASTASRETPMTAIAIRYPGLGTVAKHIANGTTEKLDALIKEVAKRNVYAQAAAERRKTHPIRVLLEKYLSTPLKTPLPLDEKMPYLPGRSAGEATILAMLTAADPEKRDHFLSHTHEILLDGFSVSGKEVLEVLNAITHMSYSVEYDTTHPSADAIKENLTKWCKDVDGDWFSQQTGYESQLTLAQFVHYQFAKQKGWQEEGWENQLRTKTASKTLEKEITANGGIITPKASSVHRIGGDPQPTAHLR